jgi:hypothetical protein
MTGLRRAVFIACVLSTISAVVVYVAVPNPWIADVITMVGGITIGVLTALMFGRGDL